MIAKELLIYTMEVPCCQALHLMVKQALKDSKRSDVTLRHYIVRVFTGKVEEWTPGRVNKTMIELERVVHEGIHPPFMKEHAKERGESGE